VLIGVAITALGVAQVPFARTEPRSDGRALFDAKCGMCHGARGMGTHLLARRMDGAIAPLEKRDDLTPEDVIVAARSGIGNMPRITRGDVSDAELKQIADYLAKLRP